ncbi:hypothetical protein MUY27_10900 [Mucilaginibacter sp. RS28]|uniref:FlgD/Vpr Ig-like domain-containing protein n=1 Tax=Mucilaginibacter straminoryzae TaxID=2932774 RepID=A0A9X1X521_9SPHI|nr:FlgD immunoglobulin-like domain containing protein [Mucilaginibacter straminoryzae]MCJ8210220.1 hypothetical protein [Mucilaginibacter straminoryzae]
MQDTKKYGFTFSLSAPASTSAGVFAEDGTLLKTLWSGVKYTSGPHKETWDGMTDDGKIAPKGTYTVRVLSNNVAYQWEGVVGNTSDSLSGPRVHHADEHVIGITISGSDAYYVTGYNEQSPATFRFKTNDPQRKFSVLGKGIYAACVATDGQHVFWGGADANIPANSFVYATANSDDSETDFEAGKFVKTKFARSYKSAIDVYTDINAKITGMAVQQNGPYLFVAHGNMNKIDVLDKTRGTLIGSVSINSPKALTTDLENNLWLIATVDQKAVVEKLKIKSNGDLSKPLLTLSNLVQPLALGLAPDQQTVAVIDGDNSQQVKAFDTKTGAAKWTMGIAGGYKDNPDVRDDKFYFNDMRGLFGACIAFQPDGSFWLNDVGNCRLLHFSADRKVIGKVMFLTYSYSMGVDDNNPQRLFSDFLEFKIDYSKPLNPNNGSWTLVKNWGFNIPKETDNKYLRLKDVTTLSNGHTFATLLNPQLKKKFLAELPDHGPLRFTSITFDMNLQLYPDGSLRGRGPIIMGKPVIWTSRALTGFNAENAPVWGTEKVLATLPAAEPTDPMENLDLTTYRAADITSSNILIQFNRSRFTANNILNWHLGGIRIGDSKWLWRTAKGTSPDYKGPYPPDGSFDNRRVNYAGSTDLVMGRNVFWGYYGEGWGNGEVNKWNHVYDDGLFIGQFGTTTDWHAEAQPMMAGNAFAAKIVKDKFGHVYIYHNDESFHSGVHRWRITGLNTIKEQEFTIKVK